MTRPVAERIREAVRDWIGGRRIVLTGVPIAATPRWIGQLRNLGAGRVLVVGTTLGTGDLPDPDHAEWVDLDIRASDPIDEFRQFERLAADPPPEVTAVLDRFDPRGDALLLTAPFQAVTAIAGRPVAGSRRPEWVALEDKTTNDALFDRAGIDRPLCEIVAADDRGALGDAAARLDEGQGTIWSGDATGGFNGGGVFVRWVTNDAQATGAQRWFAARCRSVRIAPFLEGTPPHRRRLPADRAESPPRRRLHTPHGRAFPTSRWWPSIGPSRRDGRAPWLRTSWRRPS